MRGPLFVHLLLRVFSGPPVKGVANSVHAFRLVTVLSGLRGSHNCTLFHMVKRSFFKRILLITVFLLGFASEASSWFVTIGGINYYVEVTGYGADAVPKPAHVSTNSSFSGSLVIPSSITFDYTYYVIDSDGNYVTDSDGNRITRTRSLTAPVNGVGAQAFKSTDVTSVVIGSNVKWIGYGAFNSCTKMTSLYIPNSVDSIAANAFGGLHSLTDLNWNVIELKVGNGSMTTENIERVTLGSDVKVLPTNFLLNSKVTEVILPNSVTDIGHHAFKGCSQLSKVVFGNSVKTIAPEAFLDCSSLTSIDLPNSLTSLGNSAFKNCTSLTHASMSNSMTTIPQHAFQNCSGLKAIIIPNSVTTIESRAFINCSSLTTINIPNTTTTIAGYAFQDCSSLSSVTIGKGVTSIGQRAFYNCKSIKELRWNAINCSETGMDNCSGVRESIEYVTIGPEVEVLPEFFVTGSKIKQVTIPNSVTTINRGLFSRCTELKKVIWNAENTPTPNIDQHPFIWCNSLTQIIIGKDVKAIGDYMFYIIDSDNHVDSVLCFASNPPTISIYCFDTLSNSHKTYNNATLYVPEGSLDAYRTAEGWKEFVHIAAIESYPEPGDVDGDGKVSIADVTAIIEYLLTLDDNGINPTNADVDNDGHISIADLTELIDILLTNN